MQTTLEKKQQGELVQILLEKEQDIKALRRQVQILQTRLEQRSEKTKKDLKKLMPFFKSQREKIVGILMELPPLTGLSHKEIGEEFSVKYPMINPTNLQRRTRECVSLDKTLWSRTDEDGVDRFYLVLKDLEGGGSS